MATDSIPSASAATSSSFSSSDKASSRKRLKKKLARDHGARGCFYFHLFHDISNSSPLQHKNPAILWPLGGKSNDFKHTLPVLKETSLSIRGHVFHLPHLQPRNHGSGWLGGSSALFGHLRASLDHVPWPPWPFNSQPTNQRTNQPTKQASIMSGWLFHYLFGV